MDISTIVSLISVATSFVAVGVSFGVIKNKQDALASKLDDQHQHFDEKMDNVQQLFETKIDAVKEDVADLKEHVDKHNKVIERTYILEGKVDSIEKQL